MKFIMGKSQPNSKEIISDTNDSSFISILISSFSTIFLAELADKTQVATLMLSAQSGKPYLIFFGAALALIFTTLLGVIIGRWISNNLPRQRFTLGAGILMLGLGSLLAVQGIYGYIQYQQIN